METCNKPCRLVLCIGQTCNADGTATEYYERLKSLLGYPNPFDHSPKLKWTTANCVDKCEYGPNLVLYPAGEWQHHLTPDALEAFIEDRLLALLDDNVIVAE